MVNAKLIVCKFISLDLAVIEMNDQYLIIGLGNPGRQFMKSRHNVGFMLLDGLAKNLGVRFSRLQANALTAQGNIESSKVVLAKPQTYMNLSGKSVRGLVRFYKLPFEKVMIVHDDLDLPLGSFRIRPDGGSGGQKGLASILEYLGTDKFPRLRIGIGRPPGQVEASTFVLDDFNLQELSELKTVIETGIKALREWIVNDLDACMNKYNVKKPN